MKNLDLKILIHADLYIRNPDITDLGRNIITKSILLINKLGFESFTFKKLSVEIKSPESSIYRYFSNKHSLLIYLTSWYWSWIDYRITLKTINIECPKKRLLNALEILTKPIKEDMTFSYINEIILSKIIITESVKAFHTKAVDSENSKGFFNAYIKVVNRVANIITEINEDIGYSHILVTTLIEGVQQQRFFLEHIPELTDVKSKEDAISNFYFEMVLKMCDIN